MAQKGQASLFLIYFYGYCAIFCMATLLNLTTITAFLIYTSPIALILFIIFHQDILQRNFVTISNKSLTISTGNSDWLDTLIRAGLFAINHNKQLIVVIENQSELKPFINTSFTLQCPITQQLMTLLIESNSFDTHKMMWCTSQGIMIAINSSWQIVNEAIPEDKDIRTWHHDALLMTLKTDTLVPKQIQSVAHLM